MICFNSLPRSLNEIYHDAAIHNLSRLTQEYKQSKYNVQSKFKYYHIR